MAQMQRPAVAAHLDDLLRFASELAEREGFAPDRVRDVELAVEESLVNILTYAYPNRTGFVEVRREFDGRSLRVSVVDNGVPFDPLSVPVTGLTVDTARYRVGGLGILFMRRLADHVAYRRQEGANVLTLTFDRPLPTRTGAPVHPIRDDIMETQFQRIENTTLITVKGRVDHKTAKAFEEVLKNTLDEASADGSPVLVLDLSGLEYMTSAGLRVLMIAAKTCTSRQQKLAVAALRPAIQEIFRISRFDLVLPVYPTVADALEALSPDAAVRWRE